MAEANVQGNRCGIDVTTDQDYCVSVGADSVDAVVINNNLEENSQGPLDDSVTGTITEPVNQDKTNDYNIS